MKATAKQPKTPKTNPNLWSKFETTRIEMQASLIERDVEIDLALTALVAQRHYLMVGPPGTAKSLVVDTIRQWMTGSKGFTVHCCKDTQRTTTFGPVKLSSLKLDRAERALEGGAADAHVLILEEVFKAGPAVLDMFLMLMNERVYREGLVAAKCPLRFLLGVSNEWSPEGCETALAAFFDRFLIRKAVSPVQTPSGFDRLLGIPVVGEQAPHDCTPHLSTVLDLAELDQAHAEAMAVPFEQTTKDAFTRIRLELSREGIMPGDRRLKQSVGACQAAAWLNGHATVQPEDLDVLAHILWVDPAEQPQKAAKIVGKIANPTGFQINEILGEAAYVIAHVKANEAVPKLQVLQDRLNDLPNNLRRDQAREHIADLIEDRYNEVLVTAGGKRIK